MRKCFLHGLLDYEKENYGLDYGKEKENRKKKGKLKKRKTKKKKRKTEKGKKPHTPKHIFLSTPKNITEQTPGFR